MTLTVSEYTAHDYKGLESVTIRPTTTGLVYICGRNGAGKSSVLDGLMAAFQGAMVSREVTAPIRKGQMKADSRVELSDETGRVALIITRRYTESNGGGTLTVESGDKARYSSPQQVINEKLGAISFDPVAFLKQDAKTQVSTLIAALGDSLGFDPEELERRRKGIYENRTEVGRDVVKLEGQLSGYAAIDPTLPAAEVTASTVMTEWQAATEHNEKRRKAWSTVAEYTSDLSKAERDVVDAEAAAARARDKRDYLADELAAAEKRAADLPPDRNVDEIKARLDDIEAVNAKIRAQQHRLAVEAELADRRAEVATLTNRLNDILREKAAGIAAADLPVPGLSFNDDGVLYNGVPFTQASKSERVRVSASLGMSQHPEIRVMRIDDGESLDSESLAILEDLAIAHGYQVWVAKVDESKTVGFTIEAGRIEAKAVLA